jgi:type I restriction enzyme S subunit
MSKCEVVPSHLEKGWRVQRIASVVDTLRPITYGVVQPGEHDPEGIPLVRGGDFASGWRPLDEYRRVAPHVERRFARARLRPGDIVITIKGDVGSCAIVPDFLDGANISQTNARLAIDQNKADPAFVLLFLRSIEGRRQVAAATKVGVQPSLIFQDILDFELPVPPIEVQRRIAAIQSTWDSTLDRLSRQIDRKEKLLSSIRERLIHGAHRLGSRNSSWPMTTLSEVTTQLTGRNGDRYGRDLVMGVTKAEGIVPMREHVVAENISRYLVLPPNGFAYNPMRINIGSIAMSEHEGDVIVSPDYVVFACKENRLHPRFLNHLRRTKAWADFMTIAGNGSVRVRIYYASLAEFEFHLPPLDEQRAIVEVLDDAEREITALEAERAALARQRDALATELLTGRLRVPQAEAAS